LLFFREKKDIHNLSTSTGVIQLEMPGKQFHALYRNVKNFGSYLVVGGFFIIIAV
jgi:hypothetical protein